jgi:hypothetical protein
MIDKYVIVECPHCNDMICVYLKDMNCFIFRHGILKSTLQQIDPHLKKETCDKLFQDGLIYGCGKPFQIIVTDDKYTTTICDYI